MARACAVCIDVVRRENSPARLCRFVLPTDGNKRKYERPCQLRSPQSPSLRAYNRTYGQVGGGVRVVQSPNGLVVWSFAGQG